MPFRYSGGPCSRHGRRGCSLAGVKRYRFSRCLPVVFSALHYTRQLRSRAGGNVAFRSESSLVLVLTATMGNSLGGLTNVILGVSFHCVKHRAGKRKLPAGETLWCSHAIIKLDARGWRFTCLLAGWMRISWGPVIFFLCLVKRYAMLQLQQLPFRA